jgi:hypothetical protein
MMKILMMKKIMLYVVKVFKEGGKTPFYIYVPFYNYVWLLNNYLLYLNIIKK